MKTHKKRYGRWWPWTGCTAGERGVGSGERGGTNRVKTKPNETKRKLAPLAADKEEAEQQEEAQTEAETVSFPLPLPHFPLPCHLPCDEASERPKERKKERSASRRGRATNYMSIEKVSQLDRGLHKRGRVWGRERGREREKLEINISLSFSSGNLTLILAEGRVSRARSGNATKAQLKTKLK